MIMTSRKAMENHKYTSVPLSTIKPLTVHICTSAQASNVKGLIDEIERRFPCHKVKYVNLPYNDLDNYTFEDCMDVVILCHSIHNRRFAITDVMDALYNDFINNAREYNPDIRMVGLIAHDFPADRLSTSEKYEMNMEAFKCRQTTAFEYAHLVMMAGKLDVVPVELSEERWRELEAFLKEAHENVKAVPILPVSRRKLSWVANFLCLLSLLLVMLDLITGLNWHENFLCVIMICLLGILHLDVACILHFIKVLLNKWAFLFSFGIYCLEIVLLIPCQNDESRNESGQFENDESLSEAGHFENWEYILTLSLLPVVLNGFFVYRHPNKLTKLMVRDVLKYSALVVLAYVLLVLGLFI